MNLRDLKYLVALADENNFRRAAEACFVSQPTLSTQIRKLEDELGVSLFERTPRKVMLTQTGSAIVQRARSILREADGIRELAELSKHPEKGEIRLGVFPTAAPYLLPHAVPRITERFPELDLYLFERKTASIIDDLLAGDLDAGILALPVDAPGLTHVTLFEEPFVVAMPVGHPLAAKSAITLDDLRREELLLLEDGHCLRDQALEVCQHAGAHEQRGFRATSLETLRHMVGARVGITLLPILAARPPVPATDAICVRPFAGKPPTRELALCWRSTSAWGSFLNEFAECFRIRDKTLLELPD